MKRSLLFVLMFAILVSVLLVASSCKPRGNDDVTTAATTTAGTTTATPTTTTAAATTVAPVTTANTDPSVNIEDLLNPK